MSEVRSAVPPLGSMAVGHTSRVHATLDGRSTLCGRAISDRWELDRPCFAVFQRQNPGVLCRHCDAKASR